VNDRRFTAILILGSCIIGGGLLVGLAAVVQLLKG